MDISLFIFHVHDTPYFITSWFLESSEHEAPISHPQIATRCKFLVSRHFSPFSFRKSHQIPLFHNLNM